MSTPESQLANVPAQSLALAESRDIVLSVGDVLRQVALIRQVLEAVMKKDVHYGVIPGCDLPSLFQPGADKLLMTFRLIPSYDVQRIDHPRGHREYEIRCKLHHAPTGLFVGEGVGSASTLETKHRWRKENQRDAEGRIMVGPDGQPVKVRVENLDPADQYNTCLKIGKKRALVDATLTVTAARDFFAQDLEDLEGKLEKLPEDENGRFAQAKTAKAKPAEKGTPAAAAGAPAGTPAAATEEARVFDAIPLRCKLFYGPKGHDKPDFTGRKWVNHKWDFNNGMKAVATFDTAVHAMLEEARIAHRSMRVTWSVNEHGPKLEAMEPTPKSGAPVDPAPADAAAAEVPSTAGSFDSVPISFREITVPDGIVFEWTFANGRIAGTFERDDHDMLEDAQQKQKSAKVHTTPTDKGKFNITGVEL